MAPVDAARQIKRILFQRPLIDERGNTSKLCCASARQSCATVSIFSVMQSNR